MTECRMPAICGGVKMNKKNLRRISILVTAQTAGNIQKLADMEKTTPGRVVDKLVRDRMVMLRGSDTRNTV